MNRSFTLIEILVVIVVIGILSAFVLVGMSSITNNANITKSKAFSNSLRDSLLMNLVSEWKLDGTGTNTTAIDSWSANNGTLNNFNFDSTDGWRDDSQCVSKGCLQSDGINDSILVGNNITMDLTKGYTIEAWSKFDSITGQYMTISRYNYVADSDWFFVFCRESGLPAGRFKNYILYTNLSETSVISVDSYTTLEANKWLHLLLAVDPVSASAKFYVNSSLKSSIVLSNFLRLGGKNATSGYYLRMGDGAYVLPDGYLDEVRIYNLPMINSRINQNYFLGVNRLYKNREITQIEYLERIVELKSNLANNE